MILSGRARLAGVLGWPVSHSLSPRLHGFWLERHGIDGAYLPLPASPEAFAAAVAALVTLGFRGANVTVPHKEAAFALAHDLTPRARRVGSVNTLVFAEDGTIHGDSTDGYGFLANLEAGAPDWDPAAGPAVVLGAGGAARSVIAALLDVGVPEIRLCNRRPDRAVQLATDLGGPITVAAWEERADLLAGAGLLVNTTSLGMYGQPPLDLALTALPSSALVTDIVYAPLITPLLAVARERGNRVVDGLGMLLHQARPGFEAWFGVTPQVDDAVRAFVLAAGK